MRGGCNGRVGDSALQGVGGVIGGVAVLLEEEEVDDGQDAHAVDDADAESPALWPFCTARRTANARRMTSIAMMGRSHGGGSRRMRSTWSMMLSDMTPPA